MWLDTSKRLQEDFCGYSEGCEEMAYNNLEEAKSGFCERRFS